MSSYKTRAIIINRLNLGESDRILTLFSPEYGRIKAICKGSRKTKSKFGGHTELFSLVDFIISSGKSLDLVNEATLARNYFAKSSDIEKIRTAYYFSEIIGRLIPENTKNTEIFETLDYCLSNLPHTDVRRIQLIFVAKILKSLGIYPELSNCIKCEYKPSKDSLYFSGSGGGITDQDCSVYFEDSVCVSENIVKLWRYMADAPLDTLDKVNAPKNVIEDTCELANDYIRCVTMIDYKSLRTLS
jgi:DNA repair protein RecO (recombination protein O)